MKRIVKTLKRRFRKDQAGQSIILLAFAFIALAAFVGLVTDISILFVRYSTLRRTIDSAAVAAAGQIREGTDYGTVALTAKQFIQLHGLEPSRVWVETCETDILAWRTGTGIFEGQGANPGTDNPADDGMPETELCDWDTPRKLVRVRAQITSPTFFLQLIGIDNIELEASAVSETAVLDVALVLDTSQSMSEATIPADYDLAWSQSGFGPSYPYAQMPNCFQPADGNFEDFDDPVGISLGYDAQYYKYGPCCNDPGEGSIEWNAASQQWEIREMRGGPGDDPATLSQDGLFDDLICQPFRQVKDAARNFIRRLDYVRGDRVALVTFDYEAVVVRPNSAPSDDLVMMTNEEEALNTLNNKVAVNPQTASKRISRTFWNGCREKLEAEDDWYYDPTGDRYVVDNPTVNPDGRLVHTYDSIAPCNDTNIGGGIRAGNDALTNAATIRRDAVWVIILLTDGDANRTDDVPDTSLGDYGFYGFCPWYTFCEPDDPSHPNRSDYYETYADFFKVPGWDDVDPDPRPQCPDELDGSGNPVDSPTTQGEFAEQICQDNDPTTRHFCLQWTGNPDTNGQPDPSNPACLPREDLGYNNERYDADDYARDWADFAGLIDITDNVPGNFIAIFTIGFGERIGASSTAAPLLRYIADAGDNGIIDNELQQDLRDDGVANGSGNDGEPGPCEAYGAPTETDRETQCGQYYYADNLQSLNAVFEAIASRLFTRIAR